MKKIKVRNWDRWQTYRSDRGMPPWIKLHRCLLRNIDWVTLTDEQRGQLVSIWILAADDDGKVPADAQALKLLCHMTNDPDLNLLRDKGFIDFDASVTPTRRQPDASLASTGCQPDANVTPHIMSDESHVIESKIPPTPRKRVARESDEMPAAVGEVIDHLNAVTGRGFSKDKANEQIVRALKDGATQDDCKLVVSHLWETWSQDWRARIDKTTPFRKANFDRYLDAARAGRVTTSTSPDNEPIPREVLANLEFELADGTDIEAWLAAQRPGWVPALRERASRMAGERR